ncbi:hypothetical protein Tco_0425740 [Tanacetum coccineum]
MVLSDNQIGSPDSVLDDKMFENSSNDSDFNVELYLNDEEHNDDNVVVPQTLNLREENRYMFSSINDAIILQVPLKEMTIDKSLHFVEEPIEILDHEVKKLKQSRIPIIKVHWNSRRGPEFT